MRSCRLATAIALFGLLVPAPSEAACTKEEAAALYARARKAFDEKRYDDSVTLLREANACDPNPVYFANIARAYEEAGKPREAIAAWKDYQEVNTDPKEKSRAQGRIIALTKTVEENEAREKKEKNAAVERRKPPEERPKPPPERAPEQRSGISIPGLIVAGVGVVGIGVGIGIGASAQSKHDSAVSDPLVDDAYRKQEQAEDLAHLATITMIAGGLVAAAGIAWIAIDIVSRPAATVGVAVNGRGVGLVGTF